MLVYGHTYTRGRTYRPAFLKPTEVEYFVHCTSGPSIGAWHYLSYFLWLCGPPPRSAIPMPIRAQIPRWTYNSVFIRFDIAGQDRKTSNYPVRGFAFPTELLHHPSAPSPVRTVLCIVVVVLAPQSTLVTRQTTREETRRHTRRFVLVLVLRRPHHLPHALDSRSSAVDSNIWAKPDV